ncbi:hypothetical protein M9458_026099, partial [Cirrhinus mrigala]
MHLVRRRARRMRTAMAHRPAVERRVVAAVNLAHQPLHLVQGARQHQDVVSGQQERGDLGQLPHRRPVRVRHDLSEPVHRQVQVVHALALPAVDLQAQLLDLLLGHLLLEFVLAAGGRFGRVLARHLLEQLVLRGGHGVQASVLRMVVVVVVVIAEIHPIHVWRGSSAGAR